MIDTYVISEGIKRDLYIDDSSINYVNKINRFGFKHPNTEFITGKGYVFFSRPDLNLFNNYDSSKGKWYAGDNTELLTNAAFYDLFKFDRDILSLLSLDNKDNNFMYLLSNTVENFELADDVLKTINSQETLLRWKMVYGHNAIESKSANTFTLSYTDDNRLRVFKLHKAWVDYIDFVGRGIVTPKQLYIQEKIIDYMSSAYYFLTGEDGETIKFYSKYTGLFPTNIPNSALSWSKDEYKNIKFQINYQYITREDMNPLIIDNFNRLVTDNLNTAVDNSKSMITVSSFNKEKGHYGQPWVDYPLVILDEKNGCYKLKFGTYDAA